MKARACWASGLLTLVGACGGESGAPVEGPHSVAPKPVPVAAAPEIPGPKVGLVEPVENGMSVAGVTKLCDDNLDLAERIIAAIKGQGSDPASLSYDSTLGRLDDAFLAIYDASEFPYLMGVTHPKEAVREAARACEAKTDQLTTSIFLDADLARVVKAYAAKGETLSPERQRYLEHTLRDFRRNGVDLPLEQQSRLRSINQELTELGQRFIAEIAASKGTIEVSPAKLAGLPASFVKDHPPGPNGKVTISTDYPDFYPFVKFSRDREAAKELYVKFDNRGGDANVTRLDKILRLRGEKAKMLGYSTWADYAIEPRMAKDAAEVRAFLDRVSKAIAPAVKAELSLFRQEFDRLGYRGRPMWPSDRYFLEEVIKEKAHKLDSKELANYFEIDRVTKGLLDITARMYRLEYVKAAAPVWHPSVTSYDVYPAGNRSQKIGRFYLDLAPRDHKYKHAAMFTVRTPKGLGASPRTPIAALVCNFPPVGQPMPHDQVVTYFHEFGHVLHHILTKTELASFAGTNTVRDFVETPSQMFEEWAWSREVLDLFAQHLETGQKLPASLHTAMIAARRVGLATATERQLFLAHLDLSYHTTPPGFDTTELLQKVHEEYFSFQYVQNTHFQSSFGHLIGYDAGYYGYQWALALAHDVLGEFRKQGLFDTAVAERWRKEVLSLGGSRDPREMVTAFLGRAPSEKAYVDFLEGKGASRVGPEGDAAP